MIISEEQLFTQFDSATKVLLIEPPHKLRYLPLGLAKIAAYLKSKNIKYDHTKKFLKRTLDGKYDLILITSIFTYYHHQIQDILSKIDTSKIKVIVGGVGATLLKSRFEKEYPEVDVFCGYSKTLDMIVPDYLTDWGREDKWAKFSQTFTTRGCDNNCAYCAVKKLEPEIWVNPNWKQLLVGTHNLISDNNLTKMPEQHREEVLKFLIDNKKTVVFDNGFDCKHMTKDLAKTLAKIKYENSGFRIAFDRIEEDGVFQEAIKMLLEAGIPKRKIMAFVLFNFNDKPKEADYRARECVKLGIRPYPQQFVPLNKINKKDVFIGKYWTQDLARAFRYFYLMAGYYSKYDFDFFINKVYNGLNSTKNPVSQEGIKAFYLE